MTISDFNRMFPDPRQKLGYLFWQINMLWIRSVNQNLGESDLTHTQMITLASTVWLNSIKDEVNQKDLVEAIKVDRMMVSKMVSKLEKLGYIERVPSEKDTRAMAVFPTEKGIGKLQEAFPLMKKTEKEFFGLLGEDEPELRKMLQQFLDKIEEQMNIKQIDTNSES